MTIRKISRVVLAIFAAATTLLIAQDGPALAGVQELIRSLFDREPAG
jgi:hypothetical protein